MATVFGELCSFGEIQSHPFPRLHRMLSALRVGVLRIEAAFELLAVGLGVAPVWT